jgi:hypothetical protein
MIFVLDCYQIKFNEPIEIYLPPNTYHTISLSGDSYLPDCPFKRLQFFLINHVSSFNETWLLIGVVKNSGIASPGGRREGGGFGGDGPIS